MNPESLPVWRAKLLELAKKGCIGLCVLDEAHCAALWQFRLSAFESIRGLMTQELASIPKLVCTLI